MTIPFITQQTNTYTHIHTYIPYIYGMHILLTLPTIPLELCWNVNAVRDLVCSSLLLPQLTGISPSLFLSLWPHQSSHGPFQCIPEIMHIICISYTYSDIYRQLAIIRKSPDRFSLLFRFVLYCFDPFLFGSPHQKTIQHKLLSLFAL